jgi:hypothetical protein
MPQLPSTTPVQQLLRMTTSELEALLLLSRETPKGRRRPVSVVVADTGRRPRPSKEFRKLSEEDRDRLLGRESQDCGPGVLTTRVRAVIEAKNSGDPRALAGTLEDLAAAALNWADRTILDMRISRP